MSLTNEQYQEIMRMYEANRLSSYNLSRERRRQVYAQIPQMRELDREMAHNAVLLGRRKRNFRRKNRIKIKSQNMASGVCVLTSRITDKEWMRIIFWRKYENDPYR